MTRNHAISLPRHPPGPPRIAQPSDSTDTAFSALKNPPTLRQHSANCLDAHLGAPKQASTAATLSTTLAPPFRYLTTGALCQPFNEAKSYVYTWVSNPYTPPHSCQVTDGLTTRPRWHLENFTFCIWYLFSVVLMALTRNIVSYLTQPSFFVFL